MLVPTHRAEDWAGALAAVALDPARRAQLSTGALRHARGFSWQRTTDALLDAYGEATRAFRTSALEVAV
jgi:D-inositol-3-phosphate glycosyltransferase